MDPNDKILAELEAQLQDKNVPVQRIVTKNDEIFRCTAKQLRAAAAKNPSHPHAAIFQNAVIGIPDDQEVHVCKVDLLALMQDKTVRVETSQSNEIIGGRQVLSTIETKYLNE